MVNRDNLKDVAAALAMVSAAILVWSLVFPARAYAQLAVSDAPVEAATADMDQNELPNILSRDTATATSVTTGGGGGLYTPADLSGPGDQLFSGINTQNFDTEFPGWTPLLQDSTTHAIDITTHVLTTYKAAIADAESLANPSDRTPEIEKVSSNTTNLLTAVQANTEAVLTLHNDLQALSQQVAALVIVEATKGAEEMNANAQERASESQGWWTAGE